MDVYFLDYENIEEIEGHLLEKVCMDSVENMSEEELRKIAQELNIPTKNPHKYMIVDALQMAIRRGGVLFSRIVVYITRMISRLLIGRSALLIGGNVLNVEPRGLDPRGRIPRGVNPRGPVPRGQTPRGMVPRGSDPSGMYAYAANKQINMEEKNDEDNGHYASRGCESYADDKKRTGLRTVDTCVYGVGLRSAI